METVVASSVNTLQEALARLTGNRYLLPAIERLGAQSDAMVRELRERVVAEIPAFSESRNPDTLPQLAQHAAEYADELLRLLRGGEIADFGFVSAHARRRAEQRFPLEALLHAYRCGHKVFSHRLREAVLSAADPATDAPGLVAAIADFSIEYTDAISTVATSAYVAQTRLLADVAGDQRARLLNILLSGYDEADGRVTRILRDAGYLDHRQSFCIVLAQPIEPAEMQNPARARRLADAIGTILQDSTVRRLVDVRDNLVTGVFSHTRRSSGWTAPNAELGARLAAEAASLGTAVLVGVSNDVPSTSQIPQAYREAALALEFANVGNRVVQFSAIAARRLILHLARDRFLQAPPAWASAFMDADRKSNGALASTLRAYANSDMNVLKASDAMLIHPNTVYARMQKILELTGLDARTYHGLTELLMVADSVAMRPRPDS